MQLISPRQQTLLHTLAILADDIRTGALIPGSGALFRSGAPCDPLGHLFFRLGDDPAERQSATLAPLIRWSGLPSTETRVWNTILNDVAYCVRDVQYIADMLPQHDATRGPSIAAELLKLRTALIHFYEEI